MNLTFFIPVYKLGDPINGHDASLGTSHYSQVDDLFAFEPDAIDYLEVSGEWPKKELNGNS